MTPTSADRDGSAVPPDPVSSASRLLTERDAERAVRKVLDSAKHLRGPIEGTTRINGRTHQPGCFACEAQVAFDQLWAALVARDAELAEARAERQRQITLGDALRLANANLRDANAALDADATRLREALEEIHHDLGSVIEDAMVLREEAASYDGLPDGLVNALTRIRALSGGGAANKEQDNQGAESEIRRSGGEPT